MEDATKTIVKLRRLAEGKGNEAETAAAILKALEAKYPDAAMAVDDSEDIIDVTLRPRGWHELQLALQLGDYLGCEMLKYTDQSISKGLFLRGPRKIATVAKEIFKTLAKKLDELHRGMTIGFVLGALPVKREATAAPDKNPLSPDALEAARLAHRMARKEQPHRQLEAGGRR